VTRRQSTAFLTTTTVVPHERPVGAALPLGAEERETSFIPVGVSLEFEQRGVPLTHLGQTLTEHPCRPFAEDMR